MNFAVLWFMWINARPDWSKNQSFGEYVKIFGLTFLALGGLKVVPSVLVQLNNVTLVIARWLDLVKYLTDRQNWYLVMQTLGMGLLRGWFEVSDQMWLDFFSHFSCTGVARGEKADLGRRGRPCGERKRREGERNKCFKVKAEKLNLVWTHLSCNLYEFFRREEKRARKERKHQKRQKNVSSSTEESPAKVGSCQYFKTWKRET